MTKIYLAGPITGCTFEDCTNWREAFQRLMASTDTRDKFDVSKVQCLSPMRGKDYLAEEKEIFHDYPEHVLSCQRGIMTRDFFDCTRADLVVANLFGAPIVSIGTVMEIAWAFQAKIPVIAIMDRAGNLHDHPMIREAIGFRVEDLRAAAHTALMILWPERYKEPANAAPTLPPVKQYV